METKKLSYNKRSKAGSINNPYLQHGDIIYVGKSSFNTTTEVLTEVLSPFSKILEGYLLYKALD